MQPYNKEEDASGTVWIQMDEDKDDKVYGFVSGDKRKLSLLDNIQGPHKKGKIKNFLRRNCTRIVTRTDFFAIIVEQQEESKKVDDEEEEETEEVSEPYEDHTKAELKAELERKYDKKLSNSKKKCELIDTLRYLDTKAEYGGLLKKEMKEELDSRGVDYPSRALKAELLEILIEDDVGE